MSYVVMIDVLEKTENGYQVKKGCQYDIGSSKKLGAHLGHKTVFTDIIEVCPALTGELFMGATVLSVDKALDYYYTISGKVTCSGYVSDEAKDVLDRGFGIVSYSDYSTDYIEDCPNKRTWTEDFTDVLSNIELIQRELGKGIYLAVHCLD